MNLPPQADSPILVTRALFDRYVFTESKAGPTLPGSLPNRLTIKEKESVRGLLSDVRIVHRYGTVWVGSADVWRTEEHQFPGDDTIRMRNGNEEIVNTWSGFHTNQNAHIDDYAAFYMLNVPKEVLAFAKPELLLIGYEPIHTMESRGVWRGTTVRQEVYTWSRENREIGLGRFQAEILVVRRRASDGAVMYVEAYEDGRASQIMQMHSISSARADGAQLFTKDSCRRFADSR